MGSATGSVGRSSTAVASGVELDLRNIFDGRADSDTGLRPLSTCSPCSRAWRRKAKASGAEWRRCSYTVPMLRKKGRRLIVGGMWAKRGWMQAPTGRRCYIDIAGTWLVVNPKLLRPPRLHASWRRVVAGGREGIETSPCVGKRMSRRGSSSSVHCPPRRAPRDRDA